MKILSAAFIFLVILTVSSATGLNDAVSVWIPEHRCLKKINSGKCDSYECIQKCSGKPQGRGRCRGSYCICTYFCHEPPK
ncbi:hypothetical protein Pfo_003068 [Paulownia fortunei]|nr:hypothetical protein Pfo_003068 [Paulownia fortunei]